MTDEYVTDDEYPEYFSKLNGLRARIARDLPTQPGLRVLDLATGYGYFALELAMCEPEIEIIGIDISEVDISKAKQFNGKIKFLQMDATSMSFPDEHFDIIMNFLGLEDIHMTKGKDGIQETFQEVSRILKPGGYFCFVVMPPEMMETEAQRLEVALFSYICNATWLSLDEYRKILYEAGFMITSQKEFSTGKKLTSAHAKEEIKFACVNVPKIYSIQTPTFDEVWTKFGDEIESYGLGHYSKVVMIESRKEGE
ncbi:MAG: class I SAM-dependent methyltransferase [Thermoplasmata archaeon]|nr:class I SAM-dependent methyltransferase [Thermoplasmata archaeon]